MAIFSVGKNGQKALCKEWVWCVVHLGKRVVYWLSECSNQNVRVRV